MYKLSSGAQKQILSKLAISTINITIKESVEKFLLETKFKEELSEQPNRKYLKVAYVNLIDIIEKFIQTKEDINWQNYCKMMNNINHQDVVMLKRSEKRLKSCLRKCLQEFYLFIFDTQLSENERQKFEPYISLFIDTEILFKEKYFGNILVNNYIRTNFPLDSLPDKMVAVKHDDKGANVFINCRNPFIFKLLKEFLLNVLTYINFFEIRLFFYYFEESLRGNVQSFDKFNYDTFKSQYLFFKKIEMKYHTTPKKSPVIYLVKFYLYIDEQYYLSEGIRLFASRNINKELLINPHYLSYLSGGYELLYKNSFEPVPQCNKWVLLYDENINSAKISKSNCMMDFTPINDEKLRQDLKEYIWQQNISNKTLKDYHRVLSHFIITYDNYKIENVIYLNKSKGISNDFLLKYRAVLEMRNNGSSKTINYRTLNNELKIIEKFLKHYKEKYKINDASLQIFKSIRKTFNGGNPIEPEEFEAISSEFSKNANNTENELYFIIFQLTSSTKLRVGEVINLERDCIISSSEALGYGEIEYVSKTSFGEKIREILLLEDINLIKRALELTEVLAANADDTCRKYIFLIKNGRFENSVLKIENQYRRYFKNIIEVLKRQGLVKKDYVPYNARHTYIDNAWAALEDGLISDVEVLAITGNTAQVAAQHYRKYKTKKYVEATYMLSIGDVQLDGTILQDEQLVEKLPQVQRGVGGCNSQECIKDELEDTDYKCLVCKKFVTSLQRMELFEDKLKEIQHIKSNTKSEAIINYYKIQEKLYGSYLAGILALSEELTDDTIS